MRNIKEQLEALGFSRQDADVYLELLKMGESAVGPLIEKTGLHRELVYGALKRLEQQGYVQSIEKKKIRHYQITDPQLIARKAVDKAEMATNILPDLEKLFNQPEVSVRIFEGAAGYEEMIKDWGYSLEDKEEFYCIGGAGESWYEITKDFYKKYFKALKKRGIIAKTVTYENEAKSIRDYEDPEFNPIRVLPESYRVPSSTIIYADKIAIQIFGERPLAIVIQSKAVRDAYKANFDLLWSMAKEYKKASDIRY